MKKGAIVLIGVMALLLCCCMAVTIPALIMPAQVTPTVRPTTKPTIKPSVQVTEEVAFTNTPTPSNTPSPTQRPVESGMVTQMRMEFNNGCVGGDANYDYCDCVFNYILNKYGESGLIDKALNNYAELEAATIDGAIQCMHLY